MFKNRQVDSELRSAIERLHRLQVSWRWWFNLAAVVVLVPPSLWHLRREFQLWQDYFTWVAVRYGLAFHPVATLGLLVPIALITSTLVWQTRNIYLGLPQREIYRLEQQVRAIRERGQNHWLWQQVWGNGHDSAK